MKIEIEEIVEIDLDSFRAECHVFRVGCGPMEKSLCGAIPRCEQSRHAQKFPDGTPPPYCGHKQCGRCLAINAGQK